MSNKVISAALLAGFCVVSAGAQADERRSQTSNVIDVTGAAASTYQGAAWLIRSENEIEGRVMTKVTTAGDAYTLWVVLFNNPGECSGGCDATDIGNPDVGASVFYGTAAISAPDGGLNRNGKPAGGGVINLDFEIESGGLPSGWFVLVGDPNGLAVDNGYDVELHLVVDRHPPVPAGMSWIPDLTTTNFPGGGPATNDRVAVFLPCPDASCPATVL